MSKINSNSKGRYKGRHNGHNGISKSSGGQQYSKNSVFDSNGPCGKVRGNVSQIIDKYEQAAKDARSQNENVLAEVCLQYADHYSRIALTFAEAALVRIPVKEDSDVSVNDKSMEEVAYLDGMDLSIPDFSALSVPSKKEELIAIENT